MPRRSISTYSNDAIFQWGRADGRRAVEELDFGERHEIGRGFVDACISLSTHVSEAAVDISNRSEYSAAIAAYQNGYISAAEDLHQEDLLYFCHECDTPYRGTEDESPLTDDICAYCEAEDVEPPEPEGDYGWSYSLDYAQRHPEDPDARFNTLNGRIVPQVAHLDRWNANVLDYYSNRLGVNEQLDKKTPLFGVELECAARDIAHGSHIVGKVKSALPDFVIVKSDSSTGRRGMEIVSVPATQRGHLESWGGLFGEVSNLLKAEFNTNHGMHVHVSRSALTPLEIGKFLSFFNNPNDLDTLIKISGRRQTNYWRNETHSFTDAIFDPRRGRSDDRYTTVNMQRDPTLEVRCLKASLNKRSFLGRLEFVVAATEFVKKSGIKHINFPNFFTFVERNQEQWRWLFDYLGMLELVNHPNRLNPEVFTEVYQIENGVAE